MICEKCENKYHSNIGILGSQPGRLKCYRHEPRNGGWKSLDGGADREPKVRKRMEEQFSGFTWNYFVEQVRRRSSS